MDNRDKADSGAADLTWGPLYKVGAAAGVVTAVLIAIVVIIFVAWRPPTTVFGWFSLFNSNPLLGLLDMDLLLIADELLLGLILLALYAALRRTHPSFMLIALTLGLIGNADKVASATAFQMLSLGGQYASATTEAERNMALAAGQAMLATWQGTAYDVGYVVLGIALLLTAVVMLRSTLFTRRTAYVGIVLGVMSLVPPTAGPIGLLFSLASLVPLEIWYILVARRLARLDHGLSKRGRSGAAADSGAF